MSQALTTFALTPHGNLQIALTDAGREALREDWGFDGDGQLTEAARERYDPVAALDALFAYQVENGWDMTSSREVGALVSEDAPMISDSIVRDDNGEIVWYGALYWYEPYAILDPVAQLAKEQGTNTITFTAVRDLTWSGKYLDLTRQADGSLLVEPTEAGKAWLAEDAFAYPTLDELLEDHLAKQWTYEQDIAPAEAYWASPDTGVTYTLSNPWDDAFTFQGSPQEALDRQGRAIFQPLSKSARSVR